MGNATKALLIAAAVLIVIVIVALGVSLLSSTGETAQEAEQVGEEIHETIGSVSSKIEDDLKFDLTRLFEKLGKNKNLSGYSKQLKQVYLCKYEGSMSQAEIDLGNKLEGLINNTDSNPKFSIVPVKLTTNEVYRKILEINPDAKTQLCIGITTTNTNITDSNGKYTILVIVVATKND